MGWIFQHDKFLSKKLSFQPRYTADAKTAIQEMAEYSQKWHNGTSKERSIETSDGLAAIQAQLNNLGREIKKASRIAVAGKLRANPTNCLSPVTEYSEEDEAEAMAETMEQYMSKTRTDYGSGVARPKIDNKYQFELKGQFLKELRENTFSGSNNEDANKHIEKVLEIVDLFHKIEEINNFQQEPDETLYQAWERFKELLMKCPQHYLTEIQEVILFYDGLDIPTRQILDSRGVIPTMITADAKTAIQEMAEYSQKWHNGTSKERSIETSDGLAAIQAQLNNLGREIKKVNEKVYAAQVGYEQCKGPHYTKYCPLKEEGKTLEEAYYTQMSKVLQERGFGSLPSSTKTNLRDQVKSISTIIDADQHSIRRIGSPKYTLSTGQNSKLLYKSRQMTLPFPSRLDNHYCEEEEEGNYGPKFTEAYGASHINNIIP
ncbi:hypothetical protein Tco_0195328 [Tanacetum coccineum]